MIWLRSWPSLRPFDRFFVVVQFWRWLRWRSQVPVSHIRCSLVIREKRSYGCLNIFPRKYGEPVESLRRIELPNHCITTIKFHKPPHCAGWLCQAGTVIMAGLGIARLMMAVVVMMIVIGPLMMVNWAWRLALQWTVVAGCIHFVVVGSIFCVALKVSWIHGVSFNDC